MENYLVTGGAGFIGSNIVEALVQQGKKVRIIDNFLTGKKENLIGLSDKIECIEGDIRNLEAVEKAVKDITYIIHLAALPSVSRSVENPLLSNEININGTLNLLKAAEQAKVKRLIFASSSSVYGGKSPLPVRESYPAAPISPYGLTKLTGEMYARLFYELYGLETIALRYFNVFGPKQDPTSHYAAVIPKFITSILKGEPPTIFGDGEQSRDFTYVSNVADANIKACSAPAQALGKSFNIACGYSINLNDLVRLINKTLNKNVKPVYAKERPGDIKHSLASYQEAKKYIGFTPLVSIENGLKTTIEWFRNNS